MQEEEARYYYRSKPSEGGVGIIVKKLHFLHDGAVMMSSLLSSLSLLSTGRRIYYPNAQTALFDNGSDDDEEHHDHHIDEIL